MERPSGEVLAGGAGGVRGVGRRWRRAALAPVLIVIPLGFAGPAPGGEPPRSSEGLLKLGEDLFNREWKPNDPRCHGGDGLGPVYNETSCVACHGLGGPGGAGPNDMNVEAITAVGSRISAPKSVDPSIEFSTDGFDTIWRVGGRAIEVSIPGVAWDLPRQSDDGKILHFSTRDALGRFRDGFVFSANGMTLKSGEFDLRPDPDGDGFVLSCAEGSIRAKSFTLKPDDEALSRIHPGLVAAPSVVVHRFGVDPRYETWRPRLMARVGAPRAKRKRLLEIIGGNILASERSSPPLFGLGLVDALPDKVLVATAEQEPPQVRGRVSRMKSGRIGRFGWKAQTADLREFVLAACAGELGLEVPGHGQSINPLAPDVRAQALDLSPEECDALVAYVKALPAPIRLEGPDPQAIEAGRKSFEAIGCADCHRRSLGGIEGIYSDLLLHDMGPDLISVTTQNYYGTPTVTLDVPASSSLAEAMEWRTPPLWGYRDSGPYLHDGRAANLQEVVRFHGGQSAASAKRFVGLSPRERTQVEMFLESLAAPPCAARAAVAGAQAPDAGRRSMLGSSPDPARVPHASTLTRADAAARAHREHIAASRLNLARTLEKMDNPRGALVFYREIVRDHPDTDAARTAAARIKALGGEEAARSGP